MKRDCCKNKVCSFKLSEVHNNTPLISFGFGKTFKAEPVLLAVANFSLPVSSTTTSSYNNHSPPFNIKQPLYLSNQAFRI